MLNNKQIKDIERKLNDCAELYYSTENAKVKELNRGYCQGIAFALDQIGYAIEWDDGKATIVKLD